MFLFLILVYCFIFESALSTAPTISGILVPISIYEATSTETLLDVFTVSDGDGDVITACSLTGHNGEFDLRQLSTPTDNFEFYILSTANLNYDNNPSYTLTVTCTDSAGESASETFTIDITPNQVPALFAPTASVNVNENENAQRRIYVVNVTDPEGDAVSCSISAVSPAATIFGIWQGSNGDYEIYLLNNPNLNYDVASTYVITVQCSDAYGSSSTQLTVDVEDNAPPVFVNLPAGSNPSLDASSTLTGTSVYIVIANDSDSATLTFSMTSSPVTPDVFQINADTGEITTSQDLIYTVDTSYDLTVTVSDGDMSTSEVLRVELTDVNTAPVITNLPDTISKSEEMAGGNSIFKLSVSDPDANETITFTWSVTPSVYTSKFSLDNSNYVLSLAENESLDYESQSSFALEFSVSDQKAETGPYALHLNLIDENEPCTFDKTAYYVTTYEANKGGGTQDPEFIITDPDSGDSYTLTLVTSDYSNLFRLDPNSGELSFDTNYDVDNGVHPSNVTLAVQCSDAAGETGTATLSVTVVDVNDNTPEFGNTGYIIYCDQWDAPGTKIGDLSAQDDDSGDNGDIEYSWVPTDSQYYTLNSNGAIILKVDPTVYMSYGATYRFIATARDQGSPRLSSTTTVDVVYREVTTTTPTTTTEAPSVLGFFDEPGNVAWVVCAVLLAFLFLALLLYTILRYCGKRGCQFKFNKPCGHKKLNCCKTHEKTTPTRKLTVKPDPKPTPFDFWNDDDLIHRTHEPFKGNVTIGKLPRPARVE